MEFDKETQEKIQELQAFEHTFQNILMQKQAFQIELSETENALKEVEKTIDRLITKHKNFLLLRKEMKLKTSSYID